MSSSSFAIKIIFFFCGLSVLMGVLLCLTQSPTAQAQKLADAGQAYYTQAYTEGLQNKSSLYLLELSARTYAQAISLDPVNANHWSSLTSVLRASGAEQQADAALAMAEKLKSRDGASVPVKLAFLSTITP